MKEQDVHRLRELTGLMLDHRLAVLRQAAEAKAQTEAALASLARPMAGKDDLLGASSALAALAYERWADARRVEINQLLARQTHVWMEARDVAQIAFGKAEALRRLQDRL
jgi:high-affinity Fe2+/Pb2+ permease